MNNRPISIKQAAEKIGVSYDQLYYAINTGKINARRLGHELYFLFLDLPGLRAYLKEKGGK